MKGAGQLKLLNRQVNIPIFFNRALQFTIQIEADDVPQGKKGLKKPVGRAATLQKYGSMGATQGTNFKSTRTQLMGNSRSASRTKSRIGSEVGSISRRSSLRPIWSHNDFTVFRIISNIAAVRMEIFLNNIL